MDIPEEPPARSGGRHDADDSRFPAGMRHRSPILDHIENMGSGEQKESKKRQRKEREQDEESGFDEKPAAKKHYKDFLEEDGDEERQPAGVNTRSLVTTAVSIILIVILIMGAMYIYNNFDDITRWLSSPTIPEAVRPEARPTSVDPAQAQPAVNPLAWLTSVFTAAKPDPAPTANTTVPATAASQDPAPAVTPAVVPAAPSIPSDTVQPTVYDFVIKSVSDRGAIITWKTSEACISEIHYKTDTGETRIIKVSTKPEVNHMISLTGLDSGQKYYIKLQCQDNAGNINEPVERDFQTLLSAADTIAPQLIGRPTVSADDSSATISWVTDEKAKSQVKYGPVTGDEFPSSFTDKFNTSHSVFLSGLSPSTTYHYRLISRDASGNTMTLISDDCVFKTEPETGASPYMGSRAPNFTLKNLKGEDVSLSQFRGRKVILNFWASWCTPCKVELPHFQTVWDKFSSGDEAVILTVAGSQSDEEQIRSFVTNGNYTFIVCLDPGEDAFNKYDLTSIPRTYFIDKDGVIRRIQQGMFTGSGELEFMINSY
jgi:peroxiredoxin